jgi:hypothetical protein
LQGEDKALAETRLNELTTRFQNDRLLASNIDAHRKTVAASRSEEFVKLLESLRVLKSTAGKSEIGSLPGISHELAHSLMERLTAAGTENRQLRESLNNWPERASGVESLWDARTFVSEKAAALQEVGELINQARIEVEVQIKKVSQAALQERLAALATDMKEHEQKFAEFVRASGVQAEQLRNEIAANVMSRIEERRRQTQSLISKAQGELQRSKEFFSRVQQGTKEVERAMAAARVAIAAAGSIPSGIIAGTASGTFTDYPRSLMEVAKIGSQLAELAARAEETYEGIRNQIDKVEGEVQRFKSGLASLDIEKLQQQLQIELDKERAFVAGEGEKLNVLLSEKRREAAAKAQEISGLLRGEAELVGQQAEAKVRQFEAMRQQAEITLLRAQGAEHAAKHKAADRLLAVNAILDRVEQLGKEITDIDASLAEVGTPQSPVPVPEAPSAALRLALDQAREAEAALDRLSKNPETVDVALIFETSTSTFGPSVLEESDEFERKMEETNQALFRLANWLFFMKNDPSVLDWAIWCRSPGEALVVFEQLRQRYNDLMKGMAGVQPETFAIQIRPEHFVQGALPVALSSERGPSERQELWFRVSSLFPPSSPASRPAKQLEQAPLEAEPKNQLINPKGLTVYEPVHDLPELLFWPEELAQGKAAAYLFDVYVIPKWSDDDGRRHPIGIEPIGPTGYRVGNAIQEQPWLGTQRSDHEIKDPTWFNFNTRQNRLYNFLNKPEFELFSRPIQQNYPEYMGLGMDNTWRLIFSPDWGPDKLDKVTVVFSYVRLTPISANSAVRPTIAPDLPTSVNPTPDTAHSRLARRKQEYEREVKWYSESSVDVARSPVAIKYRIDQLDDALTILPDIDALLATNEEVERSRDGVQNLASYLIDPPALQPQITSERVRELVAREMASNILALYGGDTAPKILNYVPLSAVKREVMVIVHALKDELEGRLLPDLTTSRETLDSAKELLENAYQMAQRVSWEHERLVAQRKWLDTLSSFIDLARAPELSDSDRKRLHDAVQWAEVTANELAFVRDTLVRNPQAANYFLAALFTAWHEALIERGKR